MADLGGARGAVAPPPFLPSQKMQKNECIDIKTQQNSKILAFSTIFCTLQNTTAYTLPWVAPTTPLTLYMHQLNQPLLKSLSILLKNVLIFHHMAFMYYTKLNTL